MATDPSKYVFNHSMLRVKDPQESVKFYNLLGMTQINEIHVPGANFSLYFLAYDDPDKAASPDAHWTDRQGILELTHNHGSENDASFKVVNGNSEPHKGFGHVCCSVDNIQAACSRLESAGVKFQKKLTDGRMKHIAFALDPDGYWVELIGQNPADQTEDVKETDPATYRFNHTMIRVKSAETSLKFYQEVMGMTLLRTVENPSAAFNLYFLGYPAGEAAAAGTPARREGLLELTWNYGTEKEASFAYHDGNTAVDGGMQGFGHVCVAVDDLDAACDRFAREGARFKKKPTDGRMRNIAFLLDPDGYWIEVIQSERFKSSGLREFDRKAGSEG